MNANYSVFKQEPLDFSPRVEAAGCYCQCQGKFLLLLRHPSSPQGLTWGIPAGKLEQGETPEEAVVREIFEETGLDIKERVSKHLGKLFIRLPHVDYVYHIFDAHFDTFPELNIGLNEHLEARWVTRNEALALPLIKGAAEVLDYYLEIK